MTDAADPTDSSETDGGAEDDGGDDRLAVDGDELAGVVDLFGWLTREELDRALSELAFKHRVASPEPTIVDDAIERYQLVDHDDRLYAGPAAFPALPDGAGDLVHILDIDERSVDPDEVARTVEERFRTDTARALGAGDEARITYLLDVSYDLDSWGPVDLTEVRARLDDAAARAGEPDDE